MNDKSYTLIILQVQSLLHLLIFPSVIHHCILIIIGQYVKTNTIVITSLSSLNITLFSTEGHIPKWKLNRANWDVPENFKKSSDPIADFTSSLIEISKECIPQTSTNPTKSNPWYNDNCKNSANKLYLNSKDLQIPTILMTSKYLELKPEEQLNFRSVSHGDLMFRKSIIKHLLKFFSNFFFKKNRIFSFCFFFLVFLNLVFKNVNR